MISLYGGLARAFEKKYQTSAKNIKIQARSVRDVVQGMEANFKGFGSLFKKSGAYRVSAGDTLTHGKNVPDENLTFAEDGWHIMPVAAGCKSGWGQALFGAVLIGAALFFPPLAAASWAVGSMTFSAASIAFGLGAGMVLGGIAQELAPSPNVSDYGGRESADARPSYLGQGPTNRVEPGLTLPVAYGDCWCGSITVSAGMRVEDI